MTIGEEEMCRAEEVESRCFQGLLIRVERSLVIAATTSYLSMRLIESTNHYIEALQRDEHVGLFLGMLNAFYSAALFQPAMLSAHSRRMQLDEVCMSTDEFVKMVHHHMLSPIVRRIMFLLFFSFDWLGNPMQLLLGVGAGLRELVRQPCRKGLIGIPTGIVICLCSMGGSILDSVARFLDSTFKAIVRVQRLLYTRFGVRTISNRGPNIGGLSRMPTSALDGLHKGVIICYFHLRLVWLEVRDFWRLSVEYVSGQHGTCATIMAFMRQSVLFIIMVAISCILGMLGAIFLFLHSMLTGVVCALYQGSAEAVCDWHPMQLFALELPLHVRPRDNQQSGDVTNSIKVPFAILPAIALGELGHSDDPFNVLYNRDTDGAWNDDAVVSAVWCGSHAMPEGEACILVDTGKSVALLQVSGWGGVSAAGRPKRIKARYRWLWRVPWPNIMCFNVLWRPANKLNSSSSKSLRSLGQGQSAVREPEWILEIGVYDGSPKFVHFVQESQVFRAFELLTPGLDACRRQVSFGAAMTMTMQL